MGRIPPAKVKRELRQEVNFGCAICGMPLIEYHHIIPYSEIEHHDPDHMIALCPTHHQLSDDSAISKSELYDRKEDPELADVVEYEFYFDPDSPIIPLGSNLVEIAEFGRYTILQIEDEPVISVNYVDGRIEFDVNFYNDSDDLIAVITDNEWWADTNEFWDMKYQSRTLTLWNEKYKIGFKSEYYPENSRISIRGRFLYESEEFIIHPSSIKFPGGQNQVKGAGIIIGGDDNYTPRNNFASNLHAREMDGVFLVGENSRNKKFAFAFSRD